jgi:hypothetical protein
VLNDDVDQARIDDIRAKAQALPGAKTVAIDGSAASTAYQHGHHQLGHDASIMTHRRRSWCS